MNREIKNSLLGVLMVVMMLMPAYSSAQISTSEYRNRVLGYSNKIKESQEQVRAVDFDIKSAKKELLPRIDGSAEFSYLINKLSYDMFGMKLNIEQQNYGITVTAAQNVYAGGIVRKQIEALEIGRDMTEQGAELTRESISYAADISYWRFATTASYRKASQEYLENIEKTYKIVEDRYADGLIGKTDLLMVQTSLKSAQFQLSEIEKGFQDAKINFNILMGEVADKDVMLADSLLSQSYAEPKFIDVSQALEQRPEYLIAQRQVDLDEQSVKITNAEYMPKLAVGLIGQRATPDINFTGDALNNAVAFAQLNVPIFRFNQRQSKVMAGRARVESSRYAQRDLEDSISQEVNVAWYNFLNSYRQLDVVKESLEIAEQSVELNTFSYEQGMLTILDVLQSQLSWINAYNSVITTHFEYLRAEASYRRALGLY